MTLRLNSIKRFAKRSLQYLAASFGKHARSGKDPQLLILMYHRILPDNDPRALREEPGMIVTPESFRLHIGILKQYFDIVHLSEWIALKNSGAELPARACAITFDDGWADNYEFAFPILNEMKVPATIFLVSEMIDTNRQFWPERLSQIITAIAKNHADQWSNPILDWITKTPAKYAFANLPPTQEELSELIAHAKVLPDQKIHALLDQIEDTLKLSIEHHQPSLLNWQQLTKMSASGLIEAGSHTCNHIRLNDKAGDSILKHEIINSKQQIEEKTGHPVKTFCFPNGDYSAKALALVQEHYEGGVSTEAGWNTSATNSHLLHRIGIHEDISKDKIAFLSRISGWM